MNAGSQGWGQVLRAMGVMGGKRLAGRNMWENCVNHSKRARNVATGEGCCYAARGRRQRGSMFTGMAIRQEGWGRRQGACVVGRAGIRNPVHRTANT